MADISISASGVLSTSGQYDFRTAGVAITAGQALYIDTTDSNKAKLADSDGTTPANSFAGIALHAAAIGQPIKMQTSGLIVIGATLLAGDSVWLSDTPGGLTKTFGDLEAGDTVVHLGVMTTTTTLNLNPTTGGAIAA